MKQEFAEGDLRERFNNAAELRMAGVTGEGKDSYAPDLRNDDYGDGGAAPSRHRPKGYSYRRGE